MKRFFELAPGQRFRTGEIETPRGLEWFEFAKYTDLTAYGKHSRKPIKFHALTPVWPI